MLQAYIGLAKVAVMFIFGRGNEIRKAESYLKLSSILTAQACHIMREGVVSAENYLRETMAFSIENGESALAAFTSLGYTNWAVSLAENKKTDQELSNNPLDWGLKAMTFAEHFRSKYNPDIRSILVAYEAISRALVAPIAHKNASNTTGQVYFYDENFQNIIDTVTPIASNYLSLAERCVQEGLMLTRKTSQAYDECTFSLLAAQVEWLKITCQQNNVMFIAEVEKILTETYAIAGRIEFRMLLTDIHVFCVEVLIDLKNLYPGYKEKLLGLTAAEHIKKTREYAIDTSTYEDLFLPPDGTA
ncbi:MAG: hypothetical protein ABUT20_50870, partial [Bacteroidota bacterium]